MPFLIVGSKYQLNGKRVPVKETHVHEMFNKNSSLDFDFALVELNESLVFGLHIQPIKIGHTEDLVTDKLLTISGWGWTSENGTRSQELRAVRVPVVDRRVCQKAFERVIKLTPRMLCAGFKGEEKDSCNGDSGGPAVASGRLIGITSFGLGCGRPSYYGVYSNVAEVRQWIERKTGLTLD